MESPLDVPISPETFSMPFFFGDYNVNCFTITNLKGGPAFNESFCKLLLFKKRDLLIRGIL